MQRLSPIVFSFLALVILADARRFLVKLTEPALVDAVEGGADILAKRRAEPERVKQLAAALSRIRVQQTSATRALPRGFEPARLATERGPLVAAFSSLVNAISVEVPDNVSDAEAHLMLQSVPHVAAVYRERLYKPALFSTLPQIRAFDAWAEVGAGGAATAGAGTKIAIVDAGITKANPMFSEAGMQFPPDIPSPGRGEISNTNAKLVVSRMYSNPANPPVQDTHSYPAVSSSSHGVHTGSTAGGRPVVATFNGLSFNISGVAPASWIMNYRIFYESQTIYAGDTQVIQAFEDATADGAQVVSNSWGDLAFLNNMSLLDEAIAKMIQSGIVVVFAAGNSGPEGLTIDRPGPALRVAAVTKSTFLGSKFLITDPPLDSPASYADGSIGTAYATTPYSLETVDDVDILACSSLSTKYNFQGGAVVVKRGDCLFSKKVLNVQAAGAGLAIVFNHEVGGDELISMGGNSTGIAIGAVFVGNTDGKLLVMLARNDSATVTAVPGIGLARATPDIVASFSSRGPTVDMRLAPDIAAPGVSVLAAGYGSLPNPHIGYGVASGTSMAAPHIAGVSALVFQQHPGFTPKEVASALMTTAVWKTVMLPDGSPAQPLDVGAGRVDALGAVSPVLFIDPPAADFSLAPRGQVATVRLAVSTYTSSISVHTAVVVHDGHGASSLAPSFATVTPAQLNLTAGGVPATVTVSVDTTAAGLGDFQAFVTFTDTASLEVAHVPLWIRVVCQESERVDVFVIDADTSSCVGSTEADLWPVYQSALNAAGLTHESWAFDCTGAFAVPDRAAFLCSRSVLLFTGTTVVDFKPSMTKMREIMHAGVPVIQLGMTVGAGWGLTSTTSTVTDSILSMEFAATYLSQHTITRIGGTGLSPSAFSPLYTTVSGLQTRPLVAMDVDHTVMLGSQSDDPLLISYISKPTLDAPFSQYNSKGITGAIGLESIPPPSMRSQLVSLLYRHATETVGKYSISSSGAEPTFTVTLVCDFAKIDVVVIGWGDGSSQYILRQGDSTFTMKHSYTARGSYTPTVIVYTELGRAFNLNTSALEPFVLSRDWPASSPATVISPMMATPAVMLFFIAILTLL